MCTAISLNTPEHYFGRTLDYDISYGEMITITPRIFPFCFRRVSDLKSHYALIGMATVSQNYPLYYDAMNEKGLAMAGLLFPDNAVYNSYAKDINNIAPYEFIPWILSQCKSVSEAKALIKETNIIDLPFSSDLPQTPMHWLISDKDESITVEPMEGELKIYGNPIGALTNNPPFNIQLHNLSNYMMLSPYEPENRFLHRHNISPYCRGMGAIGLPGDFSSQSRFIRAVFLKANSVSKETEFESINQFFHILNSAFVPRGSVITPKGKPEITQYSSCLCTGKGTYYYQTYENSRINGVSLRRENLNSDRLICYSLINSPEINIQN